MGKMFEIRSRDDVCGNGMFATEDIPYDTEIVKEDPLFVLHLYEGGKPSREDLYNALSKLSSDDRARYARLFGDDDKMRWAQNHFSIHHEQKTYQQKPFGIYPQCARLNHSCSPNAMRIYHSDQSVSLVAIRKIAQGEEITITYMPHDQVFASRETRQTLLRKRGIFTTRGQCMCVACVQGAQSMAHTMQSDANRLLIKELLPENTVHASRQAWTLLHEEGLSARLLSPEETLLLVFPSGTMIQWWNEDDDEETPLYTGRVVSHRLRTLELVVQGETNDDEVVVLSHSTCIPMR